MSEQEKDKRTKKGPRKSPPKASQKPVDSSQVKDPMEKQTLPDDKKVDDKIVQDKKTEEKIDTVTDKSPEVVKPEIEDVKEIEQKDDIGEKEEQNSEETPTLSGWLAYGFNSIVKSAKDTVQNSGTLESIKRDLVELRATVQSTSASSVLNSTANMVKNTLNEIGQTVNDISSLGTSLPDEDDGNQPEKNDDKSKTSDKDQKPKEKRASMQKSASQASEGVSVSSEEDSLFNFSTLNTLAHKFGESARSTLTAVKDVVVDSLALKSDHSIDELGEDAFVLHNGVMLALPGLRAGLYGLQVDGRTFIKEPEGTAEAYEEWLSHFSLIDYEKQMEFLIENVPELASIRETLVPGQLSETDFWHRYYYKAHLLKDRLKKEAVEQYERMEKEKADKKSDKEDSVDKQDKLKEDGDSIVLVSKPASVASSVDSTHVSRSSTDDWDKVGDKTSDDEKDWVKCD